MIELEIFTEYIIAKTVCYLAMGFLLLILGITAFKATSKFMITLYAAATIIIFYNLPKFVVPKAAAIELLYKLGAMP